MGRGKEVIEAACIPMTYILFSWHVAPPALKAVVGHLKATIVVHKVAMPSGSFGGGQQEVIGMEKQA